MKRPSTCLVLLMAWGGEVHGATARGLSLNNSINSNANVSTAATAEVLYTATVDSNGENGTLIPQNNFGGWVNPEYLAPMPQCIAQQDQSTWLSAMTRCTSKRCTSRFAFFCTHYQWLTQLSCLSTEFSPDLIRGYMPYCGRSVLAKAHLYLWVRKVTGRTWLVDVGDANGLENLSPASLTEGYAPFDVTYKAPTCLTSSVSALSMESFQRVMASCGFTSTTEHTGNAARPWEYSESLRSMIVLDSETAGYDLAGRSIGYGDYFDKACFCGVFTVDPSKEPCSLSGKLDLTKERLWINATCGPTSLPDHWADTLQTTEFACIPIEDWQWPKYVADMPKQVIEPAHRCATDACELDSGGYCEVKPAIDRACFCHDVSYDSCGESCDTFENRIDYINWLHDVCGNVQDWHGLPDNWRQLAVTTPLDLIPWRWSVRASNDSNIANPTGLASHKTEETCASNEWKLGSFALVNLTAFLAAFVSQRTTSPRIARGSPRNAHPLSWFLNGILIAALHLFANTLNVFLVQNSSGYEDVPAVQLILLWCTMPRPTWLTILLVGLQPFGSMNLSAAASAVFAETILQILSSYYMVMTVNYGRQHNFYLGVLENAERGGSATLMYAGALMWLIVSSLVLVGLIRASHKINRLIKSTNFDVPEWQRGKQTTNMVEELMVQLNERCIRLRERLIHHLANESGRPQVTLLTSSGGGHAVYGTFSVAGQTNWVSQKAPVALYATTVLSLLLLWIAQWLFWGGFIGLSLEEYCPPNLELLTAVWSAFSMAGATVGAT
ncbi:hypothetical protein F5B17DRAFT_274204 [Nemania serpens]|nr:hypothetical protein F5B17DRAFT_274204 [Nemania serpens]